MADMATYIQLAKDLPPWQALLVEGDHGIGKSDGARQLADELGLPLIDMRLSLMEAGDLIGLPEFVTRPFPDPEKEAAYVEELTQALKGVDGREAANAISAAIATKWGKKGETRFAPPSWLLDCGEKPYVLFLDEMNRARQEVEQASFQLILDRNINGHFLHPDTRIIAAINTGFNYKVEPMDPALKDRFAVVRLEPSKAAWLKWAKESPNVHHAIVSFIRENEQMLEVETGTTPDPNRITPSRRSWERCSRALVHAGLLQDKPLNEQELGRTMNVVVSMCGPECANAFITHLRTAMKAVTADDVLKRYDEVAEKIDFESPDYLHALNDRIIRHLSRTSINKAQAENYKRYVEAIPDELKVSFHSNVLECGHHKNLKLIAATNVAMLLVTAVTKTGITSNRPTA